MSCAKHPQYVAWWQVNGVGFCQYCKSDASAAQKKASELTNYRHAKGLCVGCGKPRKRGVKVCPNCGRGAGVDFKKREN